LGVFEIYSKNLTKTHVVVETYFTVVFNFHCITHVHGQYLEIYHVFVIIYVKFNSFTLNNT